MSRSVTGGDDEGSLEVVRRASGHIKEEKEGRWTTSRRDINAKIIIAFSRISRSIIQRPPVKWEAQRGGQWGPVPVIPDLQQVNPRIHDAVRRRPGPGGRQADAGAR